MADHATEHDRLDGTTGGMAVSWEQSVEEAAGGKWEPMKREYDFRKLH